VSEGLVPKKTRRLFFALWPSEQERQDLTSVQANMSTKVEGRAVRADTMHLTLYFLGSVETDRVNALLALADGLRCAPFSIEFDRYIYWRKPQIVSVQNSKPVPQLMDLYQQLETGLITSGFITKTAKFSPHVTLFRKVKNFLDGDLMPVLHWQVQRFCLVESNTLPTGAVYTVLSEWPLLAQAAMD